MLVSGMSILSLCSSFRKQQVLFLTVGSSQFLPCILSINGGHGLKNVYMPHCCISKTIVKPQLVITTCPMHNLFSNTANGPNAI